MKFSDLDVLTDGKQLRAHRLVIACRTDYWGDLNGDQSIDFETTYDIANTVLEWIYTDNFEIDKWGVTFMMEILKVAHKFKLNELAKRSDLSYYMSNGLV